MKQVTSTLSLGISKSAFSGIRLWRFIIIGFILVCSGVKSFSQCTVCATCTTSSTTGCNFTVSSNSSQNFSFAANSGGKMCIDGGTYTGNVTIIGGNNLITIVVAPGAVFSPASITYGVFINGSFTLEVQPGGTAILPDWALGYNGSVTIRNCGVIHCTGSLLLPGTGTGNGNVTIQNNGIFTVAGTLKFGTNGGRTICNSDTMHLGGFLITGNISNGVTNNGYIEVDSSWVIAGTAVTNTLCPNSLIYVKGNWTDNSRTKGSSCGKIQVGGVSTCNSCQMTGVWDFCDTSGAAPTKIYPNPKVDVVTGFGASWAPTVTFCSNCILSSTLSASANGGSVCVGSCFSLSASGSGGTPPYTYSWSPNIGAGAGPFSVCPGNTTIYTVTVTDAAGAQATDTAQVTLKALPLVDVNPPSALICNGLGITLSASGAVTYTWTPATGLSSTNIANPFANPATTTTYTVTGTGANGCTASASTTIKVGATPVVNVTHSATASCDSNTIYIGYGPQSITLTANTATVLAKYQWYLNGGAIAGDTTNSITVSSGGDYNIIVTDTSGCFSDSTNNAIVVKFVDIRCGHNNDKVLICHVPDCKYPLEHTLCIAPPAIAAHLKNHPCDCLGNCSNPRMANDIAVEDAEFNAYPNPFTDETMIEFTVSETGNVKLELFDMKGALTATPFDAVADGDHLYQIEVDGSKLQQGVYIGSLTTSEGVKHLKLIVTK